MILVFSLIIKWKYNAFTYRFKGMSSVLYNAFIGFVKNKPSESAIGVLGKTRAPDGGEHTGVLCSHLIFLELSCSKSWGEKEGGKKFVNVYVESSVLRFACHLKPVREKNLAASIFKPQRNLKGCT